MYYYIVLRDIGLRYLVSNLIMMYVLLELIIYWMLMGKELIWLVESMKFGNVLGYMYIYVYKFV